MTNPWAEQCCTLCWCVAASVATAVHSTSLSLWKRTNKRHFETKQQPEKRARLCSADTDTQRDTRKKVENTNENQFEEGCWILFHFELPLPLYIWMFTFGDCFPWLMQNHSAYTPSVCVCRYVLMITPIHYYYSRHSWFRLPNDHTMQALKILNESNENHLQLTTDKKRQTGQHWKDGEIVWIPNEKSGI